MSAYYSSRKEQRKVTETMSDLLLTLKKHSNDLTDECIRKTLEILENTEIREDNE